MALLAVLAAAFAAADVANLASRQRSDLTSAIAVAAGAAWDRTDSWAGANLAPVVDLATRTGADVEITDQAGQPTAVSPAFRRHASSPQVSRPIVVRGQQVGRAVARFPDSGLGAADQALRTALWRAIAGAAGLAALLALITGLVVARRITRPVERLITVTRAMGRGDRTARVGPIAAPGEIGELATAFDLMADTLDRQEQLRRDLVADVAHELRTPIAVLQAGHEALLDGVTEPTQEQLASLRDEVLRLARMVGDLQTLAAADAAALQLTLSRHDLADIAAGAADSLAGRFEAAGVALERQLTPVDVLADPGRLHQVITNLLTNALKFTPSGGRVTVRAGRRRRAGRAVRRRLRSPTPGRASPPTSCPGSSTGSGAAGGPGTYRAAVSGWPWPPNWPAPTGAGWTRTASRATARGSPSPCRAPDRSRPLPPRAAAPRGPASARSSTRSPQRQHRGSIVTGLPEPSQPVAGARL